MQIFTKYSGKLTTFFGGNTNIFRKISSIQEIYKTLHQHLHKFLMEGLK